MQIHIITTPLEPIYTLATIASHLSNAIATSNGSPFASRLHIAVTCMQ